MSEKFAIVSGGFDPLHIGHLHYLKDASLFGSVIVLLNSDAWLVRKKQRYFMGYEERAQILEAIRYVEEVIAVDDADGSVVAGLNALIQRYNPARLVFCNGGDRHQDNIPEKRFCDEHGIEMRFNVGGGKQESSSDILARWSDIR